MNDEDPNICYDRSGLCLYCTNYNQNIKKYWLGNVESPAVLENLASSIKSRSKNSEFDCIIGLSGGLDSSYAAYIAKEKMGLRPLLFHVDAGWNTDQAVGNIEKLV